MNKNHGKQGNGEKGTPMAAFYAIWSHFHDELLVKNQDEYDVARAVSCYENIDDPTNQGHEGGKKSKAKCILFGVIERIET